MTYLRISPNQTRSLLVLLAAIITLASPVAVAAFANDGDAEAIQKTPSAEPTTTPASESLADKDESGRTGAFTSQSPTENGAHKPSAKKEFVTTVTDNADGNNKPNTTNKPVSNADEEPKQTATTTSVNRTEPESDDRTTSTTRLEPAASFEEEDSGGSTDASVDEAVEIYKECYAGVNNGEAVSVALTYSDSGQDFSAEMAMTHGHLELYWTAYGYRLDGFTLAATTNFDGVVEAEEWLIGVNNGRDLDMGLDAILQLADCGPAGGHINTAWANSAIGWTEHEKIADPDPFVACYYPEVDEPGTDALTLELHIDGDVEIWSSDTNSKTEAAEIFGFGDLDGETLSLTVTYAYPDGFIDTIDESGYLSADRMHLSTSFGDINYYQDACG